MGELYDTAEYFGILANENRLRILRLVQTGQTYSAELANILNMASSTVWRYLNALEAAGFIKARRTSKVVFYTLAHRDTEGGKLARSVCARLGSDRTLVKDEKTFFQERDRRGWGRKKK